MPRSLRIEYPGAFYHVVARGNRRQTIFPDEEDCLLFLETLDEACRSTGWRLHAYVLMGNHYHWCLETPEPNLVAGMKWFQNTYTRRFNVRHRQWGRLFGDRYKAVPVDADPARGDYYETLLDYIHLNPVRAGLVAPPPRGTLADHPWSSLAAGYLLAPGKRPPWLAVEDGLRAFGFKDSVSGRRRFLERLEERAAREAGEDCGVSEGSEDRRRGQLRRGWYWGSDDFARELESRIGASAADMNRTYRSSPAGHDHAEASAERLVRDGMGALGLDDEGLRSTPGSDPRKVAIAFAVRRTTTMPLAWVAERLSMKSAPNVSRQIGLFRRRLKEGKVPRKIERWLARQGA